MDNATVTLKHPIQHGSEKITELKFRRIKGKDLRRLPKNYTIGDILDLAARIAGYPPSVADEIDAEDLAAISEAIEHFLPHGLATGSSS